MMRPSRIPGELVLFEPYWNVEEAGSGMSSITSTSSTDVLTSKKQKLGLLE